MVIKMYKVCRKEGNELKILQTTSSEDVRTFSLVAKSDRYLIFEDDKDVTKKYKKIKNK